MFLNPLGLLAFLAVPAVVALHLFRRRYRRQVVSALFLWAAAEATPASGRRREPLHRSPSFWCELAAAALLALALAGPRGCAAGEARHMVVALDGTASMSAGPAGETPAERARAALRHRIAGLPPGSRVTLVESGSPPRLLAGPAAFAAEAEAALDTWSPSGTGHAATPAVALAGSLSGGGGVTWVSDSYRPDHWPEDVELLSFGSPRENVGLTHLARREADDEERLHIVIERFHAGGEPEVEALVEVKSGDVLLASETVILGSSPLETTDTSPPSRRQLSVSIPLETGVVEVRVRSAGDGLALDDIGWLAPTSPQTLTLASVLSPERARTLGVSRSEAGGVERWASLVKNAVALTDPSGAHLVITDGAPPAGSAWALVLAQADGSPRHLIGPFLKDKRHPLMSGITLDGIVWTSRSANLTGIPIVSAGNDPLLVEDRHANGRRVFTLDLELERSSLVQSPDWPILLANIAELRRSELPGAERTSLVLGEALTWRDRAPAEYVLEGPLEQDEGERTRRALSARGTLVVDSPRRPGTYRLARTTSTGERALTTVAWRFQDSRESDLTGRSSGERASETASDRIEAGLSPLELLLIAAAALAIGLDWFVLRPRDRRVDAAPGTSVELGVRA